MGKYKLTDAQAERVMDDLYEVQKMADLAISKLGPMDQDGRFQLGEVIKHLTAARDALQALGNEVWDDESEEDQYYPTRDPGREDFHSDG